MVLSWMTNAIAWNLYLTLELEAQGVQPEDVLPPGDPRRGNILTVFNSLSARQQTNLGESIDRYRSAYKASEDAKVHAEYAEKYRGAPDDSNDEHEWRPTFDYFERRMRESWAALRAAVQAATDLHARLTRYRIDTAAVTNARNAQLAIWAPQTIALQAQLDQLPQQKAAAIAKIATFVPIADVAMPDAPVSENGLGGAFVDVPTRIRPPPAPSPVTWHGSMLLGKGSFGCADLWVGVDGDKIIKRRVVRKKCKLNSMWRSDPNWSNGAPGNTLREDSLPMEIHALQELADKRGSDSVVKLLNHKVNYWPAMTGELYMEYCPHGDGWDGLSQRYYAGNHGDRTRLCYQDYSRNYDLIPEPFLWSVFLSLVRAGILMERGSLDKRNADPNWACIVHRDIKSCNVLLGLPKDNTFPNYPHVKLADYGMAIRVPIPDPRDTAELAYSGTPGHAAPEMHQVLLDSSKARFAPQSTKTNVWGVGIVLYSMLAGRFGIDDTGNWFIWSQPSRREPPEFDQSATSQYSLELRNLVMACMRYDVDDRPTFDLLLREIRKYTGDGAMGDERAAGLRDVDISGGRRYLAANRGQDMVIERADKYKIGYSVG